jgi:protein O-mannosyl-transferase
MFSTFHEGHYQPLSWLTFAIDYLIWGMNPAGYHLTNLVLHGANAAFLYFVARRLLFAAVPQARVEDNWRLSVSAGFAALLFAVHPLRVESVAWATERRDMLSALFFFGAIYFYLRAYAADHDQARRRWMTGAVVVYALSLLSKATAMTLPIVLLLLDVYPLKRLRLEWPLRFTAALRELLLEKLPFVVLAVLFAVIALMAQQNTGALRPVENYFFSYRVGQAFYGLCFYLWKTLAPVSLSPLYELPYDFEAWTAVFVACGMAVVVISVSLFLLRQRWPAALACWVYYLVVVAPVLGVVQSGPQLVADRYSYLSCLSWALLAGGAIYQASNSRSKLSARSVGFAAVASLASVLLGTLGFLTWQQTQIWRDSKTLWQHAIATGNDSALASYNLARLLELEGKLPQSVESYSRAISINPTMADAHHNLARLLAQQGKTDEAIAHYREALKFKPHDAETHNNLAFALASNGEIEASLAEFRRAIVIDPKFAKPYFNLGRLFVRSGELDKAIDNFQQAVKLAPNQSEIHAGLADALAHAGNADEAIFHLTAAVNLSPGFADGHVALARLLAQQGKTEAAAEHYQAAMRLLTAAEKARSAR